MNEIVWTDNTNLNSIRVWGIIILIYTASFGAYGQSNRQLETLRAYRAENEHLLLPIDSDITANTFISSLFGTSLSRPRLFCLPER